MIGDWVCYNKPNKYIARVKEIRVTTEGEEYYIGCFRDYFDPLKEMSLWDNFNVEILTPITLTEEILEMNGWKYNDEDAKFAADTWSGIGLMLRKIDDGYRIVVTSDYDDEDTNDTPFVLKYVHELQHALRLRNIEKEIEL